MINIFNNGSKKQIRLLKEILAIVKELKQDNRTAELEKQMDEWLAKLRQEFGRLEQVSDQVK